MGFEAHGYGPASAEEDPAAMINALFQVVRADGGMGIPGIYTAGDAEAKDEAVKHGTYGLDFGQAWLKSLSLTAGQCPVKKDNWQLMMAILWGRMTVAASTQCSTRRKRRCTLASTGRMSCARRPCVAALGGFAGKPDLRVMMNMYWESLDFQMPSVPGRYWGRAIDTFRPSPRDILEPGREQPITGDRYRVEGRSIVVLISQESSTHIGAG